MKITTIDKGTAEAITSRLHDAVRDVADSMGVTVYVERTKFSTVEMSVLRELLERFRRTEPSPENVQDVADALKRLSMEPRSEALRIAVIEQLRRVLR